MSQPSVLLTGTPAVPEPLLLRAGPLSLLFDPAAGDLRYVRYNDREVIRRIYAAVRDQDWGTVPATLRDLNFRENAGEITITYTSRHARNEIDFEWHATITADAAGRLTFAFDGLAHSTFLRNRIGLCVLHPDHACAGAPCTVSHPDGSVERAHFPTLISPQSPFTDIVSFSHEVTPAVWAKLDYAGDLFEMEDQRNWLDASFKTYSEPQRRPLPIEVPAGTRVRQSVTLAMVQPPPPATSDNASAAPPEQRERTLWSRSSPTAAGPVRVSIDGAATPLPQLGLQISTSGAPASEIELSRLRTLRLSHLRIDLDLSVGIAHILTLARRYAEVTRLPLECALTLPADGDPQPLVEFFATQAATLPVTRLLLHHRGHDVTPPDLLLAARQILKPRFSQAQIGGGADSHFVDLNRNRPDPAALDVVCYAAHPQAHAFDNVSIAEAVATFAQSAATTRSFMGPTPIAVTPITLKARTPRAGDLLPPGVDPRQLSLFAAAWTLAAVKYLAEGAVHSATFFETLGWLGVMERDTGSPNPHLFPSTPGAVFPLYHVFADLGDYRGGTALRSTSSDPLRVESLLLRRDHKTRLLLANMTPRPQDVVLAGLPPDLRVRTLDETSAEAALEIPGHFRLNPGSPLATAGRDLHLTLAPHALMTLSA